MRALAGTTAFLLICSSSYAGEVIPLGPEFIATTRTNFDQHDVWVDCDDDGHFVLSYAQGDIFLRRFDRDGNPLSDDVQLNLNLTNGTQDETYLARDPVSGDFLVCYSDRHSNDGDQMGCAGRFYRGDGTPYADEQILNTHTVDSQFEPHAAFMPNGRVMVAWSDAGTDGSVGCIGRVFNRDGTPVSAEFLINTPSDKTQIDPSMACSRNGLFVCAYVDASGDTGEPREVLARLFDQNGSPLGAPFLVNSSSVGMQRDVLVAMDADGDFVVVWQDESATDGSGFGIFARLFNSSGTPKGPQFVVTNTTAGDQRDPHVSMDFVGNFVVTWESDASGDFDLYLRRFARNGNPLGNELLVHTNTAGDQTKGKTCLSQGGDRMISVWYDNSIDGDIYARLFTIPMIEADGVPSLTQTVTIDLDFPGMGGEQYMLLPSLGQSPPIAVNGGRNLHLAVDSLLLLAFNSPESQFFSNIVGTLDPAGRAQATFTVPDSPEYYGVPVYFSGLTLQPGWSGNWDLQSGSIAGVEFLTYTASIDIDGPVRVHPGQEVSGRIDSDTDEDRGLIEMTKGEKLKLKLAAVDAEYAGDAIHRLRVEILDADGILIRGFEKTTPAGDGKSRKIKFKAKQSGAYLLRLVGLNGETGHYKLLSSHKVKSKAKARNFSTKVGQNRLAKFKFLAVRDTLLTLTVQPLGGAPTPPTIELFAPGGASVNLDAFLSTNGSSRVISEVPLGLTGTWRVQIPGPRNARYKVFLQPTPPSRPGGAILE